MAETFHRNFFIAGPAGRLEALLWTVPVADPPLVAVVCHPHPLFGGTMHNKVVYQAAKVLHLRDIPVLRFNFRGAGQSEGIHDRGIGERDDVRAALDYLSAEFPQRPILLAGFSFGSVGGFARGLRGPARFGPDRAGDSGGPLGSDLSARMRKTKTNRSGRQRSIRLARKRRSAL